MGSDENLEGEEVMPRHEDLDFEHKPVHCDDCWADYIEVRKLKAMERANELKQEELYQKERAGWVDAPLPKPVYRQYTLPETQSNKGKGGVRID